METAFGKPFSPVEPCPVSPDSCKRRRRRLVEGEPLIHALPDAVLGIILRDAAILDRKNAVALLAVCRRWRDVCKELVQLPRICLNFEVDGERTSCAPVSEALSGAFRRFKGINEVQIVGYTLANTAKTYGVNHSTLTSRDMKNFLENGKFRDAEDRISNSLRQLLRPEVGLKSLYLDVSYRGYAEELIGRCTGLTTLELGVGDVAAMGMSYETEMLRYRARRRAQKGSDYDSDAGDGFDDYMELDDNDWTRINTDQMITDDTLVKILSGCPNLAKLNLGYFSRRVCTDFITGSGIQGCPNLVELDITDCYFITDLGMDSICRSCPRIQRLTLGSNLHQSEGVMTDAGFRSIATLSELEWLKVALIDMSITPRGFEAILGNCSKLSEFIFENALNGLIREAIDPLAESGRTAPSLKKVKLVDDVSISVSHLARLCPLLEELECTPWEGGAKALQALAQGCPRLESLRLRHWSRGGELFPLTDIRSRDRRVTDADIRALGEGCPHLKTFHMTDNWYYRIETDITDSGLISLLEACQGLTSIRLPGPSRVTDEGLYYISRRVKGMKSLDVRSSPGVTIAGILAVLNGCPLLEKFEVDAVPEEWVEKLKRDFRLGQDWPRPSTLRSSTYPW